MSRTEIQEARRRVRDTGWLATTPADFQATLLEQCIWQRIDADVTLTHGGDTEGGLFGIVDGAVNIMSAIGPSDSPVAHIARAPFWFGEIPSVGNQARTITVVTRTVCDVALVSQKAVGAIMAANPQWWRQLGVLSTQGLFLVTQIATDLLIPDSRRRCVAVLLRLAGGGTHGGQPRDVEVGQRELSAMANTSRQTLGIILRALQADGLLKVSYRRIAIKNPAKLRDIVDAAKS